MPAPNYARGARSYTVHARLAHRPARTLAPRGRGTSQPSSHADKVRTRAALCAEPIARRRAVRGAPHRPPRAARTRSHAPLRAALTPRVARAIASVQLPRRASCINDRVRSDGALIAHPPQRSRCVADSRAARRDGTTRCARPQRRDQPRVRARCAHIHSLARAPVV